MKKYLMIIIVLILTASLSGCSEKPNKQKVLTVSAAISMKDSLAELKESFEQDHPGVRVSFNFASSGTLQQQIEQGAPVDVFVSAGKKQMNALEKKGLVGKPEVIVGNQLVVITPAGRGKTIGILNDLGEQEFEKIAIGNPDTVPAGKYSEEALKHSGILDKVKPKLVLAKDVRQVLAYVETGEADAGLVYSTDYLALKKVKVRLAIPAELHSPIIYPAAVVKSSANPTEAELFLAFLQSGNAGVVFKKYGFTVSE